MSGRRMIPRDTGGMGQKGRGEVHGVISVASGRAEVVLSVQILRQFLIGAPYKNYGNGLMDGEFARTDFFCPKRHRVIMVFGSI